MGTKTIDFKKMNSTSFSQVKSLGKIGILLAFLAISLQACNGNGGSGDEGVISISGNLDGCTSDSMRIWEVKGIQMEPLAAAKLEQKDGKASFKLSVKFPHPGFYLIGDDLKRTVNVLLDKGGEFTLNGSCMNPKGYKLEGSTSNKDYAALQDRVNQHNTKLQGLYQNLQLFSQSDPAQIPKIQGDIQNLNTGHFAWLDSLEAQGNLMSKVASVYNFKPFMSDASHSEFPNELEYFRGRFFGNLDLSDSVVASFPQIFDKARAYSATLAGQNVPSAAIKSSFDALIGKTQANSVGHQSLLRGLVSGLEQTKNDLIVDYGKTYINTYSNDQPYVSQLNSMIAQMQQMRPGSKAPDFEQPTPEGKMVKLSDFKGKIVMIDFWASWCRPCRAENPNVLRAYNKYHNKGFEILGVSLDKEKGKWVGAIQQDKLTWQHVSDLKGWASAPAALYGVNSIPATVLVDKEGNIMARNLRGPALEEKLKEIFGS